MLTPIQCQYHGSQFGLFNLNLMIWWISAFKECKNSWKSNFRDSKCVKMAYFALLESPKLISRKIWVKFLGFSKKVPSWPHSNASTHSLWFYTHKRRKNITWVAPKWVFDWFRYSSLSNKSTCIFIYFAKRFPPVQPYLIQFLDFCLVKYQIKIQVDQKLVCLYVYSILYAYLIVKSMHKWALNLMIWWISAFKKCKNSWKSKFRTFKCVKMAYFALLKSTKLISRKIWVTEKLKTDDNDVPILELNSSLIWRKIWMAENVLWCHSVEIW